MGGWNAGDYLKFGTERTQPAVDLACRIWLSNPASVLDVGCGPGNSTSVLRARFPGAEIMGIDSSEEMLRAARENLPGLEFLRCDVSRELPALNRRFDVVFSNACIQWVPDHPALLKNLMGLLNPGGMLAVQTPMNYEEPIHQIIGRTAESKRWREKIREPRIFYNLRQEEYFDLLSELSSRFDLWQTTYFHRMRSHEAIMDWYRSTGLRPYLEALREKDRAEFEREIFQQVKEAYPVQKNGEIIFRFPRFFFTAFAESQQGGQAT